MASLNITPRAHQHNLVVRAQILRARPHFVAIQTNQRAVSAVDLDIDGVRGIGVKDTPVMLGTLSRRQVEHHDGRIPDRGGSGREIQPRRRADTCIVIPRRVVQRGTVDLDMVVCASRQIRCRVDRHRVTADRDLRTVGDVDDLVQTAVAVVNEGDMAAAGLHVLAEGQCQVRARGNAAAVILRRAAGEHRRCAVYRKTSAVRRSGRGVARRGGRNRDVETMNVVNGAGGDSVLGRIFTIASGDIAVGTIVPAVTGVLAPNWLKSMVTPVTVLVLASPLAELSHTAVTVSPIL